MPRVLLLLPTTTYRTRAFVDAALRMDVDVVAASELPSTLENTNPGGLLTLKFSEPERAAEQARAFAEAFPIDAVIPVDEDTAVAAASVAQALGLAHNTVQSATVAKDKHLMREALRRAGVPVPQFWHFSLTEDPREVAARVVFPCVVKPVFLSTSRGVMRADNEKEFVEAVDRLVRIVAEPALARRAGALADEALAEEFIPGFEVAVEGLLTDGEFRALAIFDKPDPLNGPFFEETIYVTPSRLAPEIQDQIVRITQLATRAMGLMKGPIHAELRVNDRGPWVIEVAARAIGGMCSQALRFDGGMSLEELIIRHALGKDTRQVRRETPAAGVMMIPIPRAGKLKEVLGIEKAKAVAGIEDVLITAHITQILVPAPEGASYLGFIFSRAETPDEAETALRDAHSKLEFKIESVG